MNAARPRRAARPGRRGRAAAPRRLAGGGARGAALVAGRLAGRPRCCAGRARRRVRGERSWRSPAACCLAAPQLLPTLLAAREAGRAVTGLAHPPATALPGRSGLVLRYVSHTPGARRWPWPRCPWPSRRRRSACSAWRSRSASALQWGRGPLSAPGALPLVFDLTLARARRALALRAVARAPAAPRAPAARAISCSRRWLGGGAVGGRGRARAAAADARGRGRRARRSPHPVFLAGRAPRPAARRVSGCCRSPSRSCCSRTAAQVVGGGAAARGAR